MLRNPTVTHAYKTAVFRIHNPSRRKRSMLDDAVTRNHRAYTKLLAALLPRLDHFTQYRRGKQRESAIYRAVAPMVNPLPLAIGAKAGLISDVAGQISSFIELREHQDNPSTPTAARLNASQDSYEGGLLRLASSVDLAQENAARDYLMAEARAGKRRPILYLKNRRSDGYLVLFSPEKAAYYVWLNLHPKDSRFARPAHVDGLVDIRTGEVVSFSSSTGMLFPVEFGRDFQLERFISQGRPQSAKLMEKDGHYEVHVTFEYESPAINPAVIVGIDRGIYNLASMAVVTSDGAVLDQQNFDGRGLRHVQRLEERRQRKTQRRGRRYKSKSRRAMADEAVHVTANAIVDMAIKHQGQVVMENLAPLSYRGSKRGRSSFNRVLNRTQYQKLIATLDYKLPVVGLPKPKTVSAAYTSQTCPCCGHQDRENRPRRPAGDGFIIDRFICQSCGHQADADLNAARVIALKRMWRENLPDSQRRKLMSELTENYSFKTYLRDRAEMRGEGPGDRQVGTSGDPGLEHGRTTPHRATGG